jgi:hypothetical protein
MAEIEKKLLDAVIAVTGDDKKMIREGVIKALKGIKDKARRTYLWNTLTRRAKKKIDGARRNAEKRKASV